MYMYLYSYRHLYCTVYENNFRQCGFRQKVRSDLLPLLASRLASMFHESCLHFCCRANALFVSDHQCVQVVFSKIPDFHGKFQRFFPKGDRSRTLNPLTTPICLWKLTRTTRFGGSGGLLIEFSPNWLREVDCFKKLVYETRCQNCKCVLIAPCACVSCSSL
jgi:hypothetical protein